jgi:hypothetical protein
MQIGLKVAVAALLLSSLQCRAAVLQNGDFASGDLTGWTVTGNATVETLLAGVPPSGNSSQAFIGNVGVSLYLLGTQTAVSAGSLEGALGLKTGSLNTLKQPGDVGNVVFGSSIEQSFSARANSTVSFSFNFLTDDASNSKGNDFVFVLLDGSLYRIAGSFSTLGPTNSPFTYETGYQPFSLTLASSGMHTLAFGVVDVHDSLGASAVLIDNVTVNSIPEPDTLVLLVAGLAALGTLSIRRAKRCR